MKQQSIPLQFKPVHHENPEHPGGKTRIVPGLILLASLVLLSASQAWSQGSNETSGRINPTDARDLLAKDKTVVLLDVRTLDEYQAGHIEGAMLLPYDTITADTAARFIPTKSSTVVVYCRSGHRSGIAAKALRDLGYQKILDLGGIINWPFATVKGPPPDSHRQTKA